MVEFVKNISKRVFPQIWKKINELETRIKELDPKGIAGTFNEAIGKIDQFKKTTKQDLEKAVDEKTTGFSNRFETIQGRLVEQDEKIEEFISLSKKNAIRAIAGSFELIRRTLGITEGELDEIEKEDKERGRKVEGAKG